MGQPLIPLTFTREEAIAIGATIVHYRMIVRRRPELQREVQEMLPLLEQIERRFLEAVGRKAEP